MSFAYEKCHVSNTQQSLYTKNLSPLDLHYKKQFSYLKQNFFLFQNENFLGLFYNTNKLYLKQKKVKYRYVCRFVYNPSGSFSVHFCSCSICVVQRRQRGEGTILVSLMTTVEASELREKAPFLFELAATNNVAKKFSKLQMNS